MKSLTRLMKDFRSKVRRLFGGALGQVRKAHRGDLQTLRWGQAEDQGRTKQPSSHFLTQVFVGEPLEQVLSIWRGSHRVDPVPALKPFVGYVRSDCHPKVESSPPTVRAGTFGGHRLAAGRSLLMPAAIFSQNFQCLKAERALNQGRSKHYADTCGILRSPF